MKLPFYREIINKTKKVDPLAIDAFLLSLTYAFHEEFEGTCRYKIFHRPNLGNNFFPLKNVIQIVANWKNYIINYKRSYKYGGCDMVSSLSSCNVETAYEVASCLGAVRFIYYLYKIALILEVSSVLYTDLI